MTTASQLLCGHNCYAAAAEALNGACPMCLTRELTETRQQRDDYAHGLHPEIERLRAALCEIRNDMHALDEGAYDAVDMWRVHEWVKKIDATLVKERL